jgi:hypothetical protein
LASKRSNNSWRELAAAARGPGKVYFTGGATAVLLGFREQTIDVEKKVEDFLARAEWHDTKAP